MVVVANFANRAQEAYELNFPSAGPWRLRFNSGDPQYDPGFPQPMAEDLEVEENQAAISIGPYSVLIYSQDII